MTVSDDIDELTPPDWVIDYALRVESAPDMDCSLREVVMTFRAIAPDVTGVSDSLTALGMLAAPENIEWWAQTTTSFINVDDSCETFVFPADVVIRENAAHPPCGGDKLGWAAQLAVELVTDISIPDDAWLLTADAATAVLDVLDALAARANESAGDLWSCINDSPVADWAAGLLYAADSYNTTFEECTYPAAGNAGELLAEMLDEDGLYELDYPFPPLWVEVPVSTFVRALSVLGFLASHVPGTTSQLDAGTERDARQNLYRNFSAAVWNPDALGLEAEGLVEVDTDVWSSVVLTFGDAAVALTSPNLRPALRRPLNNWHTSGEKPPTLRELVGWINIEIDDATVDVGTEIYRRS
ncbi:MAG: hypothetical protein L0H59_05275 [Tomitella sp.]|nr:hypothetical protein [Tomitella sp.]